MMVMMMMIKTMIFLCRIVYGGFVAEVKALQAVHEQGNSSSGSSSSRRVNSDARDGSSTPDEVLDVRPCCLEESFQSSLAEAAR